MLRAATLSLLFCAFLIVPASAEEARPLVGRKAPALEPARWMRGVSNVGQPVPSIADLRGLPTAILWVGGGDADVQALEQAASVFGLAPNRRPFAVHFRLMVLDAAPPPARVEGWAPAGYRRVVDWSAARTIRKAAWLPNDPTGLDGLGSPLARAYGVRRTPWLTLVDAAGIVRYSNAPPAPAALSQWVGANRPPKIPARSIHGQSFGAWQPVRWVTPRKTPFRFADHELTLVRWWTKACQHCAASVPALSELHRRYQSHGLHLVSVYHHKGGRRLSDAGVLAAHRRLSGSGDVATDPGWGKLKRIMQRAGFRSATSVSFLVDRRGVIVWAHPGPRVHWSASRRYVGPNQDIRVLEAFLRYRLGVAPAPPPAVPSAR
ncbi:MAG: hypothetical protein QNJ98_12360 [Planctomycetota bacterium]|nr:hypothetical protein [Planctomycetota bacterium]